jgi:membrane-associated phospholipid phosphatase
MQSVSNQYAAMPSLHVGWALWCALALVPNVRRRSVKVLAALYPVVTVFTVVVTGNHFWLDAVGGIVVVAAGFALAWVIRAVMLKRRMDGDTVLPGPVPGPVPDASQRRAGAAPASAGGRSTLEEASAP